MPVRAAESDDVDRIREVADSAITASHGLSPQDIETIVTEEFDADPLGQKLDDEGTVVLVAESDEDGAVAGVAEGRHRDGVPVVQWLFVDPERRGRGHGTALFEAAVDELEGDGAVRATALSSNQEGGAFYERFGYEQVDERDVDTGGESVYEQVYAPEDAATEQSDADEDVEFPESGTVTTDDGELHVDRDEGRAGTDGPFFAVYADEDGDDQYGYYCGNCGSLDTTMDEMERVECMECGNVHKPDGSEQYDESYL